MKHTFVFALCALFFISTASAEAYFTTGQEAFSVNGQIGVYTVEFAFGHDSHEIKIPITALRGSDALRNSLRYEIYDNDSDIETGGSSLGIVLSKARVENGMYVIPKGERVVFTLLMLYTPTASDTYRAAVTYLPFEFDGTQQLQLNPSELQYYKTPLLSLSTAQ